MKVLVTGAGGLVGRALVPQLAAAGMEVVALLHRSSSVANPFPSAGVQTAAFDLERDDVATLPKGIDSVVWLAQSPHFRDFPDKAAAIFEVNVAAHFRLLDWAYRGGVRRVIYASSGGIYGPGARMDLQETQPLAVDSPLGFYLGSKLCAEVAFQNYRHLFETAVILRPFFIYGPGQRKDMFIPRLIDSVLQGRAITLQGPDGLSVNPIFVEDAAAAFAAALRLQGSHIFNLAGIETVTLRQLGEIIGRAVGRQALFSAAAGSASNYVANTNAACAHLGRPRIGLEQGIERVVAAG